MRAKSEIFVLSGYPNLYKKRNNGKQLENVTHRNMKSWLIASTYYVLFLREVIYVIVHKLG